MVVGLVRIQEGKEKINIFRFTATQNTTKKEVQWSYNDKNDSNSRIK